MKFLDFLSRQFSSIARDEGKQLKSRKFDAYTWSIWAGRMASQGKVEDALNMIENRVAEKKIPKSQLTALFNTAIDICGHHGKFNRAWKLFNDMKKRCVDPNERTVVSMVNALAEGVKQRQVVGQFNSNEIWNQGQQLVGQADSSYKLNALLKLSLRLGDDSKIRAIFPLANPPELANSISFSTVLHTLARSGSYDDCLVVILSMHESGFFPCKLDFVALMMAVKNDLSKTKGKWSDEMRQKTLSRMKEIIDLYFGQFQDSPTKQLLSLSIEISLMMKENTFAKHLFFEFIAPLIDKCRRLGEIGDHIDDHLITLSLSMLAKSKDAKLTFRFYEDLVKRGLRTNVDHVNALLSSCALENLGNRADAVFRANFMKRKAVLKPTKHTLQSTCQCLAYMSMKSQEEISRWIKRTEPVLLAECQKQGLIKHEISVHK